MNWHGRDKTGNKMARTQHKIRLALLKAQLSCSCAPPHPFSPHQMPSHHLFHPSWMAIQKLRVLHKLSIGAGSPTPTSVLLLPSKIVLLLSSLLSPAYAPTAFTCTLPLCKVLLGLLRYCTNPKFLCFTVPRS